MPSPSESSAILRKDIVKSVLAPALTLLVIPVIGWGVATSGIGKLDRLILENIHRNIDSATDVPADEKPLLKTFYSENPPSRVCDSADPGLVQYRDAVCGLGGEVWQFVVARQVSQGAFVLGLCGLITAALLCAMAWRFAWIQYGILRAGWVGLTALVAIEVVVQAALATWLSYWVTALYFNIYVPKLIIIVGILAAIGAWTALRGMVRRAVFMPEVEGEVVAKSAEAGLWSRLSRLASRVGTEPPSNVIAGIDDNFFVTESPISAGEKQVEGRTLFVSVPLLRILSADEADAVLAHELAHFRGGDTATSTKLGPALIRYDRYMGELGSSPLTLPAFFLMRLFRVIFELARQRESRRRELVADRVAAETVSSDALARALLKTSAYSSHRAKTEQELFDADKKHAASTLALSDRIAAGLSAHVATAQFREAIASQNVPHPFDSHPPLDQRLQGLGAKRTADDCEALVREAPADSWVEHLPGVDGIEARLWAAYETRFVSAHEITLAYRYLPRNDEERALVEKFFPARSFVLKDGGELRLTYEGVRTADGQFVLFAELFSVTVDEGNFRHDLILNYLMDLKRDAKKIKLRALGNSAAQAQFKETFGRYWGRYQSASAAVAPAA